MVTGANGLVGSHLCRRLRAEGWPVRALVRQTSDLALLDGVDVELAYGDLASPASLPPVLDGAEVVFHAAASLGEPTQEGFDRINVHGTRALCDAVREAGSVRRFVHVSSAAAGGPSSADAPRTEADPPAPVSRYGRSKLAGERVVDELRGAVEVTVARPPAVYGPGSASMIPLARLAARGWVPVVGWARRPASLIDVRDLAVGLHALAAAPAAAGRVFYLTGPQDASIEDLQRAFAAAAGARPRRVPMPIPALTLIGHAVDAWKMRTGRRHSFGADKVIEGSSCWLVSAAAAREAAGFDPTIHLAQGAADTIADYRARGWLDR